MRRAKAHQSLQPGDLSPASPSMPAPAPAAQGDEAGGGPEQAESTSAESASPARTEQEMKRASVDAFNAGLRCFKAKEWGAGAAHFTVAIDSNHPRLGRPSTARCGFATVCSLRGSFLSCLCASIPSDRLHSLVRTGACYNLRGESRAQLGDLVGAFQDLDRSVELMPAPGERGWGAPGNIATFINRSNCYKKVGRYAAATADLRQALKLDPKHRQAKKALGNCIPLVPFNTQLRRT